MRSIALGITCALGVLTSAALRSDVDLKKLGQEGGKPEPQLGENGKEPAPTPEDHEKLHQKLAEESEANLKEIARLMEKISGSLNQKQTGSPTQTDQREVVKRLQELIDKVSNGCGKPGCGSPQQSGGESQGQEQKDQQAKKKQSGSESQRQENKRELARQNEKQEKSGGKKEPKNGGKVENDQRQLGKAPPSGAGKLADQADLIGRWGILPKRVVEQMRNSTGKEYPAEYRDIISRYYQKLSEVYEEKSGE